MRARSGDLEALPVAGGPAEAAVTATSTVSTDGRKRPRWSYAVVALVLVSVIGGPPAWDAAARSAARRVDAVWADAQALDRERARQIKALAGTYLFDDRAAFSAAQAPVYAEVARRTKALRARAAGIVAVHGDVRRTRAAVDAALVLRAQLHAGVARYLRTNDARALGTNEADVRQAEVAASAALQQLHDNLRIRPVSAARPRIAAAVTALDATTRYLDEPTGTRLAIGGRLLTLIDIDRSKVLFTFSAYLERQVPQPAATREVVAYASPLGVVGVAPDGRGPTRFFTKGQAVVVADDGQVWVQAGSVAFTVDGAGRSTRSEAVRLPSGARIEAAGPGWLVVTTVESVVHTVNIETGRTTRLGQGAVLAAGPEAVAARTCEPDSSATCRLVLWRPGRRSLLFGPTRRGELLSAAFSPDGRTLAVDHPCRSCDAAGSPLALIDVGTGSAAPGIRTSDRVNGESRGMTWSPDGKWVFVLRGRIDGKAHIEAWDLRRERMRRVRLTAGDYDGLASY